MPGMLPLQVNTILKDFTAHATPAKLNAAYASYGQQQFWQDLHTVSIQGPLGKDYAYSSAGTELIAHTLETIYGLPYEILLTQFVARAAGMHDTRLRLTATDAGRLAPGYHSDNPVMTTPMPQLPWGAAGNLKSSMPDMTKYLRLQLGADPRSSNRTSRWYAFRTTSALVISGISAAIASWARIMYTMAACRVRKATPTSFQNTSSGSSSSPTRAATRLPAPWKVRWRIFLTPSNPWKARGRPPTIPKAPKFEGDRAYLPGAAACKARKVAMRPVHAASAASSARPGRLAVKSAQAGAWRAASSRPCWPSR